VVRWVVLTCSVWAWRGSINRVVHDKTDKARITQIKSIEGADEETISLVSDVVAQGNIEEWLGTLERQMQRSLKALCERAAFQCSHMPLRDFVDSNCGQFALLGIQLNWTAQCQEVCQ
jgi:dynein heavy chain, axonemal